MATAKVTINGNTILDLTDATAGNAQVLPNYSAYGADGSKLIGSIPTQAAKTVTPTKSSQQAVASGVYTTGVVTVAPIPSQYITTTDATAAAGDIVSGETAYVNGSKVTGTLEIITYYTGTSEPSASLGKDGDIYLKVVS